jgi:hypothetical protein
VASYVRNDLNSTCCGWTMMDTYPCEAWVRLGRLLERRRGELGYGFRQRARFATERGGGKISVKTISRLENGERDSYPESTIGTVEAMYQWAAGSVESVLIGGEPDALLMAPPPGRNPITSADTPPTSGERLASWVYVRMRQLGKSDDAIHEFLDAQGFPREPTTVSAVSRIAEETGATVAEVLALLGVEDINSRRLRLIGGAGAAGADETGGAVSGTPRARQRLDLAGQERPGGREAPLPATTGKLAARCRLARRERARRIPPAGPASSAWKRRTLA